MCYHKLYDFFTCGHPIWGPLVRACPSFQSFLAEAFEQQSPITERELARLARQMFIPNPCPDRTRHPYHTLRFYSVCYGCARKRADVLISLDNLSGRTWSNQPWSESIGSPFTAEEMADMMCTRRDAEYGHATKVDTSVQHRRSAHGMNHSAASQVNELQAAQVLMNRALLDSKQHIGLPSPDGNGVEGGGMMRAALWNPNVDVESTATQFESGWD